jgi:hypothetical protein
LGDAAAEGLSLPPTLTTPTTPQRVLTCQPSRGSETSRDQD